MAMNENAAADAEDEPPLICPECGAIVPWQEGEQHKLVFAYFGLASYMAQVLEHGIVNALILVHLIPTKRAGLADEVWHLEYDSFSEEKFRLTMGQLNKELRKITAVPPDFEQNLAKSLKQRNFIAHNFFRERVIHLHTANGRDKMIVELRIARDLFNETDKQLTALVRSVQHRYGITDDFILREVERQKAGQ